MQNQKSLKDQRRFNALLYQSLKKNIIDFSTYNQQFIENLDNYSKNDPRQKQIKIIRESFQMLIKPYHVNLLCALLIEVQPPTICQKSKQVTLLSRFTKSLIVFLKSHQNLELYGLQVWKSFKFIIFCQQILKSQFSSFSKDLQWTQRLKKILTSKIGTTHQQSLQTMIAGTLQNQQIQKFRLSQTWKTIYQLNNYLCSNNQKLSKTCLNEFIDKILLTIPSSASQEIEINRLKEITQEILAGTTPRKRPCCSIYFTKNQKIHIQSLQFDDLEQIKFPLNQQGLNYIRKVYISFLNSNGGVFYIGFKKLQKKIVQTQGVPISQTQKVEFLQKVHEIVHQIYPNHEIVSQKPFIFPSNTYNHLLNKFVSVEFNPLIDSQNGNIDLFQMSSDKKTSRSYIVKLKVKNAPKYDTYMVKNSLTIGIQSYRRRNGTIQKVNPSQFPSLFYERSQLYLRQKQKNNQTNPSCPECRHVYSID